MSLVSIAYDLGIMIWMVCLRIREFQRLSTWIPDTCIKNRLARNIMFGRHTEESDNKNIMQTSVHKFLLSNGKLFKFFKKYLHQNLGLFFSKKYFSQIHIC